MRVTGFLGFMLAVGVLLLMTAVQAVQDTPAGASKLVNIELKDIPIKDAIDSIFRGTGLKYYIQPGVAGKVVEMKLTGVTVDQALNSLAEAAQLTIKVEDGAYIIGPAPKAAAPSRATGKEAAPTQPGAQAGAGPSAPAGPPSAQAAPKPDGVSQTQGGSSATAIINQPSPPVYYGGAGPYGNPYAYGYGYPGYPPMYQVGQVGIVGGYGYAPVVVAGGNPYILQRGPLPPPPPGWVGPDLLRFLRTQWAIQPRTYLSYPVFGY